MKTPGPRIDQPQPGPEPLKEILSRVFTLRGWGRRSARLHLERAWESAVGVKDAEQTRVLGLKRGVLEVEVNSAVLLQELAQYQKRRLLEALRARLNDTTIADLRFKAGAW
jgi:predicted nucleic acid-binding Zn ribbon protein